MRTKLSLLTLLCFVFSVGTFAQSHHSIHADHNEYYSKQGEKTLQEWDEFNGFKPQAKQAQQKNANCTLDKVVFGWHPYWGGTAYTNYDWNLLTDFSFFSYEVDAATGDPITTRGWATHPSVDMALANGVRVNLCVTLFSNHSTFYGSATAQQNLIDNLIDLVSTRGAHGVNIDFEGIPGSYATDFTNFMVNLSTQMKAVDPDYQISVALYSVDWNDVFNIPVLVNHVDLFVVMGYGYYYSGSSNAGPTDPLYAFTTGYNYSLSRTSTYYLNEGVPAEKLIMGLPYYGREWPTASDAVPSSTTGSGSAKTFNVIQNNTSGNYSTRLFNNASQTPYYTFQDGGTWRQAWVMDGESLETRLEFLDRMGLGGMGIWALSYDNGYPDLWDALRDKYTDCEIVECTGTIHDMGGPERNYYSNESYEYAISPDGATNVQLDFLSFNIEDGYDFLYIYDGPDSSSPLIGTYTGTNTPGTVVSTGPSITLRFEADAATTAPGWEANWSCINPPIPLTTTITDINTWVTGDFTADITDEGGNPITDRFYQACDFDGTEWRSNTGNGFFNDDFNALHSDWTSYAGSWSVTGGELVNTDEASSNTILTASLNQNLGDKYMFHWKGAIGGTGTNRRAGLHFFCSDPSLSNRGESYFVYERVDSDKLQLYRVTGNTFSLEANIDWVFDPGIVYDTKVIFDPSTGEMQVYIDDTFAGSWTDPSPLTGGDYVSFRSGNCTYDIDDFRVYRSRAGNPGITVGPDATDDIRYNSPDGTTDAGMIRSVIFDSVNGVSSIDEESFLVNYNSECTDIPMNLSVEMTSSTSGILTWDAIAGSQKYQVRYRMQGTTAWNQSGVFSNSKTMSGLTPQRYYEYRVRNQCANGIWSEYSTLQRFYTSLCEYPSNMQVELLVDPTNVKFSWDAVTDATKYQVRYRPQGASNWTTVGTTGTSTFKKQYGLQGNTVYDYRVRSQCSDGYYSNYSPILTFTTGSPLSRQMTDAQTGNVMVYPNPVKDMFFLDFSENYNGELEIRLTDVMGRTALRQNRKLDGGTTQKLDISSLENGVYMIQMFLDGKPLQSGRIVKK